MGEEKNSIDLMENKEAELAAEVPKNIAETKHVNKKMKLKVMANLRSDSKIDPKNVVGTLPKDAVVEVVSKEGQFFKVKYLNRVGYVMAKLLVEC